MWNDPALTLSLWERAIGRRGVARDEALLDAAPNRLSERNRLALQRYAALFGSRVELLGNCPHCGEPVEFDIDVDQCARQLPEDADECEQWHECVEEGVAVRFRLPTPADLHGLSDIADADVFAETLFARCTEPGLPVSLAVREAICRRIEALAPGASVSFALSCPACGGHWNAPLDAMELLWRGLRGHAEQLLADVAQLARAWGWSERDILAMSPVRRAAYLQLAAG